MSEFRIASRYAKSLLDLANEQGKLEEVSKDMKLLASVCKENRDFGLLLRNPIIKHSMKKAVMHNVFQGKVDSMTLAIFDILTKKNRENVLPAIAQEFAVQYNILKGIKKATVTTTFKLDAALRKQFEEVVQDITKSKTVELEEIVDANILGGFVLKVDDKQIDDSIKGKFANLRKDLIGNSYIKQL